jgi:hypothetical protein
MHPYIQLQLGPYTNPINKALSKMCGPSNAFFKPGTPEELNEFINYEYEKSGTEIPYHVVQDPTDLVGDVHPGPSFKRPCPKSGTLHSYPEEPKGRDDPGYEHSYLPPKSERIHGDADCSMMDSTIQVGAFKSMRRCWRMFGFPNKGAQARCFDRIVYLQGRVGLDPKIVHSFGPQMGSGRPDTSIGDGYVNMITLIRGICLYHGITAQTPISEVKRIARLVRIAFCGDDVNAHYPSEWTGIMQYLARYQNECGLTIKLIERERLTDCVFLGMRPFPCAVLEADGKIRIRIRWGKQPGRFLFKAGWQRQPTVDGLAWAKGNAWATFIANNHVPILRSFALSILRKTTGVAMKIPMDLWKYRMPKDREQRFLIPETYDVFEQVYGLSYAEITECERRLLKISNLPSLVYDYAVSRMICIDNDLPCTDGY